MIRVELWQIGDSPFAPKFETISKPNDWAKTIKQSINSNKITDTQARQLEFWNQFKAYAENHNTILRLGRKLRPQNWLDVSVGSSCAHISLNFNSFDEVIRVELYIPDDKKAYHFLEQRKEKIEKEFGSKLEWMELPGKKASRIKIEFPGLVNNINEWDKYFAWMQETAEKFYKIFSKILKKYK